MGAIVRCFAMMEDFDDAVEQESAPESGSKLGLIGVVVGIIGIVVGVTGIVLAIKAQTEVRTLEATLMAKPDKTVDMQAKLDEMDERLVKLGGEFVKLGRADQQIQSNAQKAFTDVGNRIGDNRQAINELTDKMSELVNKLENWKPTVAVRQSVASEPAGGGEAGSTGEPAAQPGSLSEDGIYTIKGGDTLSKIATEMGVSLSQLMAANPTVNPSRLQIGQKIVIPKP